MFTFMPLGFFIFIAMHLFPTHTQQREKIIGILGYLGYLALFSIISVVGFSFIIYGYTLNSSNPQLWQPLEFSRSLTAISMPFACILIVSTYLTGYIREKLKHPMLIATLIWGGVHLLANGDLASSILFSGFISYALIAILLAKPRDSLLPSGKPSVIFDLIAIVLGIGLYALIAFNHLHLFGVSILTS